MPLLENAALPPDGKVNFFELAREDLAAFLNLNFSLPLYRASQLFGWIYKRDQRDFCSMTDFKKELRCEFSRAFGFKTPEVVDRKISLDGSRKYLFSADGDHIEAVMIKQPDRMTLCVSSQAGCAIGCRFCRTGTLGLKRNLGTSEIVGQVLEVRRDAGNFGDMFSNLVFMGMGEPLHNLDNVVRSIKILTDDNGLGISARKITVSTSGLVPQIKRLGASGVNVNLAVSLNAVRDEVRTAIMPINKRYPLDTLISTLREYPLKRRQRITFEYVMLEGVNTSNEDLKKLPLLIQGIPSKINLIPYNQNAGLGFRAPSEELLLRWQQELNDKGLLTTIRWSKGSDINAACGQLAGRAE